MKPVRCSAVVCPAMLLVIASSGCVDAQKDSCLCACVQDTNTGPIPVPGNEQVCSDFSAGNFATGAVSSCIALCANKNARLQARDSERPCEEDPGCAGLPGVVLPILNVDAGPTPHVCRPSPVPTLPRGSLCFPPCRNGNDCENPNNLLIVDCEDGACIARAIKNLDVGCDLFTPDVGDFGRVMARTVAPSGVSGADAATGLLRVPSSGTIPPSVTVQATQRGTSFELNDIDATVPRLTVALPTIDGVCVDGGCFVGTSCDDDDDCSNCGDGSDCRVSLVPGFPPTVHFSESNLRLVTAVATEIDGDGNFNFPARTLDFTMNGVIEEPARLEVAFLATNHEPITGIYVEGVDFTLAGAIEDRPQVGGAVVRAGFSLTLEFTGLPPTADAGADRTVQCGDAVTLSGIAADPDGDIHLVQWVIDPGSSQERVYGGSVVGVEFGPPLGEHIARLEVMDRRGALTVDEIVITNVDTLAPGITDFAYGGPVCLWPPNHDYAVLEVGDEFTAMVRDLCDDNASLVITSATSSQPDDALGDGATTTDVVVHPDRVCLRTERQGLPLDGRVYRVELAAVDFSGNSSDPVIEIAVEHDQRKESRCIDDAEYVAEDDARCLPPVPTETEQTSLRDGGGGTSGCSTALAPDSIAACLMLMFCARRRRR